MRLLGGALSRGEHCDGESRQSSQADNAPLLVSHRSLLERVGPLSAAWRASVGSESGCSFHGCARSHILAGVNDMTTEQGYEEQTGEDATLSAVFRQTDFGYVAVVVSRALEFRARASESARSTLASSIRNSVRLAGFKDSSKALPQQLRELVMWEILEGSDDKLAGAVLRTWAESQDSLHDLVVERLGVLAISAEYPDFKGGRFRSEWPRDEWLSESEAVTEDHDDLEFDDVALMLCYVSGRIPEPPYDHEEEPEVESPLFSKWLDELNELPPDAPEWAEFPGFIEALLKADADRIVVRHRAMAEELERRVAHTRVGFGAELLYLDLDIGSWADDAVERITAVPGAIDLVEELNDRLEEYRPVRPQGSTRGEEAERLDARRECEEAILDVAARWDRLMEEHELPDDGPEDAGTDAGQPDVDDRSAGDGPTEAVQQTAEPSSQEHRADEYDSLRAELEQVRRDNDSLTSANSLLAQENAGLQSDRTLVDRENSDLKNTLSRTREESESWRRAYVLVRRNEADAEGGEPAPLRDVSDALALAERTFPDRLILALNSKSDGNTPFRKPDEVFDVLAWLSTEYHRLRTNPGASPDFNRLVKEACPGWSYSPGQAEVAKEQFADWYATTVDGKTYDLYPHIGKGASFDPQNTIRIAFAWDDDMRKVIVGYVGLHQRNRRS